ncbi:MAG: hypothetical protein V1721_10445 [Pseudomonadota bacterium]
MAAGKHANIKIVVFLAALAGLIYAAMPASSYSVACTMDVKSCPDGSYVSRTGPQCEFAPCPGEGGKGIKPDGGGPLTVPELILPDEPETPASPDEGTETPPKNGEKS